MTAGVHQRVFRAEAEAFGVFLHQRVHTARLAGPSLVARLARAADAFEKNKNYLGMARMLEQLAREMGNAFSNRRELTGRKRGPIQFEDIDGMTDEAIDQELRQIFGIKDADVHPAPEREP